MTESLYGDSVYEGGEVDQSEVAENTFVLDPLETLTSTDPDEAEQVGYDPPDYEPKATRFGTTELEEAEGESLDQRLAEEVPDVSAADVADEDAEPRAGRLVAPDEGSHADLEKDEVALDVGPAGYASSAEEAAMHVFDEASDPDGER